MKIFIIDFYIGLKVPKFNYAFISKGITKTVFMEIKHSTTL